MANQPKRSSGRQSTDAAVSDPNTEVPAAEKAKAIPRDEPDAGNVGQANGEPAGGGQQAEPAKPKAPTLNINDLKDMSIQKLTQVAKDLAVAGATGAAAGAMIAPLIVTLVTACHAWPMQRRQ